MTRPYHNGKRRGVRPSNHANWQICHEPGKFEGEGLLVQYVYDLSMDGMGETFSHEDGGESYTLVEGLFSESSLREFEGSIGYRNVRLNRSEKRYAKNCCAAILHENNSGFVSAVWFSNTEKSREKLAKAIQGLEYRFCNDDNDGDDDMDEFVEEDEEEVEDEV